MSYNPNIPTSAQIPSQSQFDFLTNFGQLNTVFNVDHYTYNEANANLRGKHLHTIFPNGAAPATIASEVALYAKLVSAASQLFFRPESAGTEVQVSNVPFTSGANPGSAGGTITYFDTIFGLRFYAGISASFSGTGRIVTFPVAYSTIITAQATANDPNPVAVSCIQAVNQLTLATGNNVTVGWFAIGRI